jgi:ADP-ribose pyrophosphatase
VRAWRTLATREVYRNPWLDVREDTVELPDGRQIVYGVVHTGVCAGVLPFVDPDTVLLVRQYRYVAGRVTWEMPTGGVTPDESPEDGAQRELMEETGYRAGVLVPITTFTSSKSILDETAHLYLGGDLRPASLPADDVESFELHSVPFQETVAMVERGEIVDAMTIIAVLFAARRAAEGRLAALIGR